MLIRNYLDESHQIITKFIQDNSLADRDTLLQDISYIRLNCVQRVSCRNRVLLRYFLIKVPNRPSTEADISNRYKNKSNPKRRIKTAY